MPKGVKFSTCQQTIAPALVLSHFLILKYASARCVNSECVSVVGVQCSVLIFIIFGDLIYLCEKQNKISESKYPRDGDTFFEIHYLFSRIIKVLSHLVRIS